MKDELSHKLNNNKRTKHHITKGLRKQSCCEYPVTNINI
jgi:hypothetical protein